MDWIIEWPVGEDDEGGYEYLPSGPIRVAIKDSACRADSNLADLREEHGETIEYESDLEAHRKLIEGRGLDGLRFQQPAEADPDDIDAYLVWVGEPDPEPAERGPPDQGWSFRMTANQVGALSEALFDAQPSNPPPIVAYACQALEVKSEQIRVEVNRNPDPVGELKYFGGDGIWSPDFEFVVRRVSDALGRRGPILKRYIAEVKHGSTSFERHQRARMIELAEDEHADVDVLEIRVDLDGAPQGYEIWVRNWSQPET